MTNTSAKIIIQKEDVLPYVYFVCSMAQRGKMYGGLSGQSDLMGGIFDRWINIIPESVIFNKYFLPKISDNLSVVSDYYEYNPKNTGIAPDVLGVKVGNEIRPFVEFVDRWRALEHSPQIEVKSFKKAQYMVNLRDQGYKNNYLVMVETDLDSDYLLPFIEPMIISDDSYEKLAMDDSVFIKSNNKGNIAPLSKINRHSTSLGSLRLITVCLASDFMNYANHCLAGESPIYIKDITETNRATKNIPVRIPLVELMTRLDNRLYRWNKNLLTGKSEHKLLDIYVDDPSKLYYIKNSKSSMTVTATSEVIVNKFRLQAEKTYIIKYQTLDRSSSKGNEFFMHKSIIDRIPSKEPSMLDNIKRRIYSD